MKSFKDQYGEEGESVLLCHDDQKKPKEGETA